ncbi:MAG: tetratricopeptide repeat protein [Sphingomonadales bacterium]
MSSFFEELKRRNVVRVGIAYLVFGWIVMQVIDVIVEPLRLPDWTATMVLVMLIIGLPIALFFAWAFELTPEGVKKTEEVDADISITPSTGRSLDRMIIGALVLAVALLVFDRFQPSSSDPAPTPPTPEPVASVQQSIAVLPFVNLSEDKSNEYFSDGLSEELLNVLTQFKGLKVAGRTSSFAFKGKNQDLREIGKALSVTTILEGSVRKQANRVRITAQLIRVSDGFHIWSDTFDRELEDIFAVQEEIATAIGQQLALEMNIDVGTSLVKARTSNMAAYELYLEGRTLLARRGDFARAIEALDQATQLDPDFAPAWGVLAQAHALGVYFLKTGLSAALARAEVAAKKALKLDPNLASAHSAMGDILRDRKNWLGAEKSYLRALEINPDEVEANSQYGQMLVRTYRPRDALPYFQRATEVDPLAWIHHAFASLVYYLIDNKDEANREMTLTLSLAGEDEGGFLAAAQLGIALDQGDLKRAIEFSDSFSTLAAPVKLPAEFFAALDDPPKAAAVLRSYWREDALEWALVAFWASYLNDIDLALGTLEFITFEENDTAAIAEGAFLGFPYQSSMRKTERFKNILRELGMVDYWRASGWPELCRPLGADDFECE